MKLFHIGDLHLGKRIYDFSMLEDQKYILSQILEKAEREKIDAFLISGDVYDKTVPPVEAVRLLDDFLTKLSKMDITVFMIAGNHDSPQRLDYGSRLFAENGLYVSGSFQGELSPVVLEDEYGKVNFYLLPFIKPATVSQFFDDEITSYEDAMRVVLKNTGLDKNSRNILICHQFVTWQGEAEKSDSEVNSLGGVDKIDASLFFDFDYTALGHLHSPQRIGRDNIRFCGSPLAYSFSEIRRGKSITVIEAADKGNVSIEYISLEPMRSMREIKGPLSALLETAKEEGGSEDYIRAVITDKEALYDPIGQLRAYYPNIMTLDFEIREEERDSAVKSAKNTSPEELFEHFFEKQNQKILTEKQKKLSQGIWHKLEEDIL